MATLQELHSMIDDGKTAVLFLPYNHPDNFERKNLKIFIKKEANGYYSRRVIFTDEDLPIWPTSKPFPWSDLLDGGKGVEATSNEWTLLP